MNKMDLKSSFQAFPAWKEVVHVILKMYNLLIFFETPVLQACLYAVDIES